MNALSVPAQLTASECSTAPTATDPLAKEISATIDLFASWGIAVLPGPWAKKGSRIEGWPALSPLEAADIARRELRLKGRINLAVRTAAELGCIDIDGKDGVDPHTALERLLLILPAGVAVYRTSRGFGVLFKPKRALGDGTLAAYGAELFTDGHLVNIPPSRHPDGIDYEWVIPPGGQLPTVDLEALLLLPEAAPGPGTGNHRRSGRLAPASQEDQIEFERLMAKAGILSAAGLARMRIHDLRHTAATLLLRAGVNPKVVSERLGHTTVSVTLDTYSHVLPDTQRDAAEALAEAVRRAVVGSRE